LLFSATMPQEIAKITRNYMNDPVEITIGRKNEGATNVRHIYYMVHPKDKYLALKRVVDYYPNIYGIVFCRTRKETQEIADNLMKDGYNADSLHGDLSQAQRDHVMNKFRNRNLQLLVATDVAARGLDVESISHIINYGLPEDNDIYTHRSGRTGRAGKTGTSISLVHLKDKGKIARIEKAINKTFEKRPIPSGDIICEKQLFNFVDKIEKVKVNVAEIERLLPSIFRKLEWLEKEDIIKRVVSLEFNRLIDYYQQADEIHEPSETSSARKEKGLFSRKSREEENVRQSRRGYARLFMNVGKVDGVNPTILMGFINDHVKGKVPVGKINVMKSFSLFEVPEELVGRVLKSFTGMYLEDRKLVVRLDGDDPKGDKRNAKSDRTKKCKKPRANQRKYR
jgi:ATP-dependent RNA helicase DeaD